MPSISYTDSRSRNALTRSALSFSMAKCKGYTFGLLLTCNSNAWSISSMAAPFSILLKQGWLQASLQSFCSTIFKPKESCLFFTTTSLSTYSSPCSSASNFFWMAGSAPTAVEMQPCMAWALGTPFSLFHASHLALFTNQQSAGLGVLQSPTVTCLQSPQSCNLVQSEIVCLLDDSAFAVSSKSWRSSCSGMSAVGSGSFLLLGFSSLAPKSLLNEFLIKFIFYTGTQ